MPSGAGALQPDSLSEVLDNAGVFAWDDNVEAGHRRAFDPRHRLSAVRRGQGYHASALQP